MRTLSKVVTCLKLRDLCILNKIPSMIPQILCYVPPSVKLLGPKTPSFQIRTHDPQLSTQIDATAVCLQTRDLIIYHVLFNNIPGSGNSIFRHFVLLQLYMSHSSTQYVKRPVILCSTTLVYHSHIERCDLWVEILKHRTPSDRPGKWSQQPVWYENLSGVVSCP